MQIALSAYQNSLFMLEVQRQAARASKAAPASGTTSSPVLPSNKTASTFQLSSLTMLAASQKFSELSVQDETVTMAYRRDGSLALQAASTFNMNVRSQEISLDVILPAESLGVPLPADLFKNGPAQISLEYHFEQAEIDHQIKYQTVKTTRKVEDILMDLTKALGEVFRRKGDKNVQVIFDDEAIKTLFSTSETAGLVKELAALLCMVNTMVLEGGKRDRYLIEISGKGKPYLDVQEQTQVQAEQTHLRLNLVIMPPAEASAEQPPAEPPAQAAQPE